MGLQALGLRFVSLALCLGPGFRGKQMLGQIIPRTNLV